jgi:hypothetical protein
LPITEALALGVAANAVMSLAHPATYDELSVHIAKKYKDAGLTGIEAFAGGYDARERTRWLDLAGKLGLVATGGSDWHGPEEANFQPGVDLPDDRSAALLSWLGLA